MCFMQVRLFQICSNVLNMTFLKKGFPPFLDFIIHQEKIGIMVLLVIVY